MTADRTENGGSGSVIPAVAAAWPRKSPHRCDHCGSQLGALNPWDWPPDYPTRTIWLHERCKAPWYDSNGLPEGVR
jgi:hypothetical protein